MNNYFFLKQFLYGCLIAAGIWLPNVSQGQTYTIVGQTHVCVGQTYTYTVSPALSAAYNYTWSVIPASSGTVISGGMSGATIQWNVPGMPTIHLSGVNPVMGCGGAAILTIVVRPAATIGGIDLVCLNSTHHYDLSPSYTGNWVLTDPNGNLAGTGTGSNYIANFTLPGVYHLAVSGSDFCPPDEYLIKVNADPAPPDMITGPESACAGIPTLYLGGNPIAGTTFEWAVSGGGSVNAMYGDESYITFNGAPNYTVQLTRITTDAAHCRSHPISKIVHSPVPPLDIIGDNDVCHSTKHDYELNYHEADIYEWSVAPNTLGSVTQNGDQYNPTVLWNVPPGMVTANGWLIAKIHKCGLIYLDSLKVQVKGGAFGERYLS